MRQEASASIEHLAHAFKSIAAQVSCIVSGLRWIRFRYLSFNSLRSRGGHGFPAFTAARLASRIATICFACTRVRLATAGQSTALADGSEILKLAHCPTCSSL